jgi:putative membrane protein insertion efficiency factor
MDKVNYLIRKLFIHLISGYQILISPLLGNRCRFYPSCSAYAQKALAHYGIVRGSSLVIWRLLRCNPLHPGGYDPIPEEKKNHGL